MHVVLIDVFVCKNAISICLAVEQPRSAICLSLDAVLCDLHIFAIESVFMCVCLCDRPRTL